LLDKANLLASPALRERLAQGAGEPFMDGLLAAGTAAEVAGYLEHEIAKYGLISNDKRELLSPGRGGNGVADFDAVLVCDHSIDEQFNQLSALGKGELGQSWL